MNDKLTVLEFDGIEVEITVDTSELDRYEKMARELQDELDRNAHARAVLDAIPRSF